MAILRRIAAVIVDAVERVLGSGARPHVGQEVLEVQPSFTDLDAASTVTVIVGRIGIAATLLHGVPRAVFKGSGATKLRVAVSDSSAVTASRAFPHCKVGRLTVRDAATGALTDPDALLSTVPAIADDGQFSKLLTDEMLSANHSISIADNIYAGYQEGGDFRYGG